MEHRRDIDGLRAVAVLPVILFHAGIPGLPGGWLGVDVFFVISGFLITGILMQDHARGGISLLRFYERRARRILPALFVVLFASTLVALLWLPPAALEKYGAGLGLTGLFLSNLWFMTETGYFANAAEVHPLIHTWSLAVEEQFYLIYPLILIGLLRWRVAVFPALAGLGIASLGFAFWAHGPYPEQVFYFPIARGWELLFGAVLALGKPARGGWLGDLGLALILGAMIVGTGSDPAPFPGIAPLVAVLGAGLILRFGAGVIGGRVLTLAPMVWIGTISYSAYLWHQPVMSFAAVRMIDPLAAGPQMVLGAALTLLSLALAWATWALVEEPVRRRRVIWLARPASVFLAAALGSAAVFAIGLGIFLSGGLPGRVSAEVAQVSRAEIYNPWRGRCDANQAGAVPLHPVARCAVEGAGPLVYFYGDSHAAMLWGAMLDALKARGQAGYVSTMGGCPALPGLAVQGDPRSMACDAFARAGLADITSRPADTVIVLALRWPLYLDGTRFDNGQGGVEPGEARPVVLLEDLDKPAEDAKRRAAVLDRMRLGIEALAADHPLVLIYPVPEAGWDVPDRLARLGMFGDFPDRATLPQGLAEARAREVEAMLDAVQGARVLRVRPRDLLCDGQVCALNKGGVSFYADNNHLSGEGAAEIVAAVMAAIDGR